MRRVDRTKGRGQRATPADRAERVIRSPGAPLASATRSFLSARFRHDFSRVRIHSDQEAAASARDVGALAYAVGPQVVFGAGRYAPGTREGMSLLAHELAHVVQHGDAPLARSGSLPIDAEGSPAEVQADRIVRAAAAGRPLSAPSPVPPALRRATRTFSLTFDDGPHAAALGSGKNRTEKVLDTLKSKRVKAGFFLQTGVRYRGGNKVGQALVARMAAEGHTVGIHTGGTIDHELHTAAQRKGTLEQELQEAEKYITKHTGTAPTFVRPPTGAHDAAVDKTYAKVALTNLLWDIDGDDGKSQSLAALKKRIDKGIARVHAAGWKSSTPSANIVVLYHDIQKGTADHLADLIDRIEKQTKAVSGKKDVAAFRAP